jgi:hypothetical protein
MYSSYSFRKRELEYLIGLTDSFTWEELPTRDSNTGYLTKAGYIPIIQRLSKYMSVFLFGDNFLQTIVRMVLNHELMFTAWYPFDVSTSPVYEIVNFTQVMSNS